MVVSKTGTGNIYEDLIVPEIKGLIKIHKNNEYMSMRHRSQLKLALKYS